MSLIDPYPIIVPSGLRPVGQSPYWTPGDTVTWTFRRFDFDRDLAEVTRPMRVIADGPDGAVLWLPGGTPTGETRIVGWEDANPHDVPLRARFRPLAEAPTRIQVDGTWRGRGVLKIVPPEVPFSVWVLLKDAGAGVRAEWYVNLETTHRRSDDALFTSDHVLDITFPVASIPLHAEDGTSTHAVRCSKTSTNSPRPRTSERGRPSGRRPSARTAPMCSTTSATSPGPSTPSGRPSPADWRANRRVCPARTGR